MDPTTVVAILTALGVGGVLGEIVRGVVGWLTGRQGRERAALRQAYADLDEARDETTRARVDVDREASYRRRISEHAHALRRQLIDAGLIPVEPFPPRTP